MIRRIFIFCVLVIVSLPAFAQRENKRENQYLYPETARETNAFDEYYRKVLGKSFGNLPGLPDISDLNKQFGSAALPIIPSDGFVDPAEYYLGPNDILDINIWGDVPLNLPVVVTPEGSLIITGVGEVQLKDKSLAEAKEIVGNEVKKKFKSSSVSVTLRNPRTFSVSVVISGNNNDASGGNIMNNLNSFIVSSVDRVNKAIYLALIHQLELEVKTQIDYTFNPNKITYFDKDEPDREKYSLRNIRVFRRNGDTAKIDLVKYFSMGDTKSNPYLRDGDLVFVPKENLETNSIAIYGEVYKPGIFEYCKGDKISTALRMSLGNLENSDLQNVELNRLTEDWSNFNTSIVNLEAIMENKAEDVELLPGDRIFVRPLYYKPKAVVKEVEIKGEVITPGKYPIIKGETKLTDIIKLAGGFTEYASLGEAKIVRKNLLIDDVQKIPEYVRLENIRLGAVNRQDLEYFTVEEAIKRGFVIANFKKIFIDKDEKYDITFEGDEIIYVPINTNSVYVSGQVRNPGYISITGNADYKYYIEKAGGYSGSAKKKSVVIIKAGSKDWKDPSDTIIESGDIIWIPKKVYYDYITWGEIFRDVTSILVSVGTLTLLVIQLVNR
jgi:protein involved in polysaccharide export with SLBB domain